MIYRATINEDKCILCGECIELCPSTALNFYHDKIVHIPYECTHCETCIDICEYNAIKIETLNWIKPRMEYLINLLRRSDKATFTVSNNVLANEKISAEIETAYNYLSYIDSEVTVLKVVKEDETEFIIKLE